MEHSIIFPLPLGIHIGFVIVSVILLILCYMKRKYAYELYMLVGIVSTLFIYVCKESPYFYILGLEELILLGLSIADMVKVSKAAEKAEKATQSDNAEEKPSDETPAADNSDKSE